MASQYWVVDDGPLGRLADVLSLDDVRRWPLERFLVANETYRGAAQSGSRKALVDSLTTVEKRGIGTEIAC